MKKQSIKKLVLHKKTVSILKAKEISRIKGAGGIAACPSLTVCPDGCPTTIPTVNA
jgi:succinate dehydrogenase/fumarate reductase-like Fe-S protein